MARRRRGIGKRVHQAELPGMAGFARDDARAFERGERTVRGLLAAGNEKKAVACAKNLHHDVASEASEALLLDAYVARIEGLAAAQLRHEARALLDLVREEYPRAAERLDALRISLAGRAGDLDGVLRSLVDGDLTAARRASIEATIQRHANPETVARSEALPREHPLRIAATALARAFTAVTSGPVADAELALPEVSRRSPLAPWKLLVKAIACFYRRDDAACARYLEAIDADAAPARLVPIVRVLLGRTENEKLEGDAARLVEMVGGGRETLRAAFEEVDRAFRGQRRTRMYKAIGRAVDTCQKIAPGLVRGLKQRVSIKAHGLELPAKPVVTAMRGASLKDAYFWRLFARRAELDHRWCVAGSHWEEFRRNAIAQKWFAAGSPEEAALYLHMADVVNRHDADELAEFQRHFPRHFTGYHHYYEGQPPQVRAAAPKPREKDADFCYFLYPDRLYERAAAMDPHPDNFRLWLEATKAQCGNWKAAERVALAWREAVPADARPLLHLIAAAEKRKAFKKALGFLKEAEAIDGLDPRVRRARLRLELLTARRHLSQRKPHLAERDLALLETLPQAREGDRPAFLAALNWVCAELRGRTGTAKEWQEQVFQRLQSVDGGILLLRAAAAASKLPHGRWPAVPTRPPATEDGRTVAELARACALARDVDVRISLPRAWRPSLLEELSSPACAVDLGQLRWFAEAALDSQNARLAFAAAGSGLARSGTGRGRFLLLRAMSLPPFYSERRMRCARAAVELAREHRDGDLLEEAVEFLREEDLMDGFCGFSPWDELSAGDASLSPAEVEEVVRSEREGKDYPVAGREARCFGAGDDLGDEDGGLFFEDLDDGDNLGGFDAAADDDVGILDLPVDPGDLPPELIKGIADAVLRATTRSGKPPELEDLVRHDPQFRALLESFLPANVLETARPRPKRKQRRRRKRR